jgi:hypothetical protein
LYSRQYNVALHTNNVLEDDFWIRYYFNPIWSVNNSENIIENGEVYKNSNIYGCLSGEHVCVGMYTHCCVQRKIYIIERMCE